MLNFQMSLALFVVLAITACGEPPPPRTAGGEATAESAFAGSWSLVHWQAQAGNGEAYYPFGERPLGRIMYDGTGHMAVQLARPDRARFISEDFTEGTAEEIEAAFEGFFAYYGTYAVNEAAGTVTHRLTVALFPNWIGTEQVRNYTFVGDTLVLSTPPTVAQAVEAIHTLKWVRAN